MKKEIEKVLSTEFQGKPLNDDTLDDMHERVLDIVCQKHKISGLRDYLDSLKYVTGAA